MHDVDCKVIISGAYTITACPQYGKTLRRYPFPYEVFGVHGVRNKREIMELKTNKNSSGDEIANVNLRSTPGRYANSLK